GAGNTEQHKQDRHCKKLEEGAAGARFHKAARISKGVNPTPLPVTIAPSAEPVHSMVKPADDNCPVPMIRFVTTESRTVRALVVASSSRAACVCNRIAMNAEAATANMPTDNNVIATMTSTSEKPQR